MKNYLIILIIITYLFSILIIQPIKASSSFVKYSGNPILSPTPNSWDQNMITTQAVMYENGLFKMWYAGANNNNILQIGYATSTDGINWTKYPNNPVLSGNPLDPSEKNVFAPTVIFDEGLYKMWYTSESTTQSYNIRYATSIDGINWVKHGIINLNNSPLPVRLEPYVIKVGNEYKMWYTSNNGKWVINYATSSDGINWTQYAGNPIIVGNQPWEGNDVAQPGVLFDGSNYKMFYHAANVSYATSSDGINWSKPSDKNPVITHGGIDPGGIIDPNPIILPNGTTLIYYTRFNNGGKIALAHDGNILIPTPTPTPLPTNTPTPTPLPPTPTPVPPTPTPSQPPTTKVVLIPGFGGSMNATALATCNPNMTDNWGNWHASETVYRNIKLALAQEGYTVLPFYYDWRKQPLDTAPKLKTFINQNTAQNERVHIVGHSMGGLLARAYIEQEQQNAKVDKVMTVGTPHRGSTDVYRIWSGGEADTGNPLMNFGILLLRQSCRYQHRGLTNKDIYRQNIPSLATFIPTYPFLRDARTNILKPLESLEAKNPWLLENSSFDPPYYGFTIGTLSGNNRQTKTVFKVREPSFADRLRGVWLDGRPTGIEFEQSGDGLVRHISSMLQNADNRIIQETHSGIVTSNQGIQEILSFLRGAQNVRMQASQSSEEPVSILGFVSTNGDFTVQTKQKTYTSERGFLAFVNPSDDTISIRFPRKVSQGRFFIIHVSENAGDAIDYDIHNVSSNLKRLEFKKHKPSLELKDQR